MNAIASKLPEGFHIGINFSASHIISPTFVDECLNFRDSFTRRDLNLVLEVTEREPLNVDESLVQRLNILHENGFVIALNQNNITFQQGYYFYKPVTYIDLVKIILSKPKVKVVVE